MRPPADRAWIPTPEQTLLLRAALSSGESARSAYAAWRARVDLQGRLDDGSFRLLPRLYKSLAAAAVSDADTARLRGIHRQSWATGMVLGRLLAEVVSALGRAGVEVIVMKGGALGRLYYDDPGERPMNDLDLLVRPGDVPRAFAALAELGWVPDRPLPLDLWPTGAARDNPAEAPIGHGWSFGLPRDPRARGLGLDVHWRAIPQCMRPDADDGFWARAVPFDVGGAPALTLAPEDHLLHALAHGVMWNVVPTIRWVADALLVARRAPIRWQGVVDEAARRGLVQPVRETLAWLVAHMDLALPQSTVADLARRPVGAVDRWRYAFALHPWDRLETLGHLGFDVYRYLEGRPLSAAPRTIARYLAQRWGAESPLAIVRDAARRRWLGRGGPPIT